jgi:hypothetical protein
VVLLADDLSAVAITEEAIVTQARAKRLAFLL